MAKPEAMKAKKAMKAMKAAMKKAKPGRFAQVNRDMTKAKKARR